MNSAVKEQWVAALKSGEFKQGRGLLKARKPDGVHHCCLGVLCEILEVSETTVEEDEIIISRFGADVWDSMAPDVVLKDIHLGHEIAIELARMNDSHLSFGHIARWIDNNL